jgi:hypothetical protein
MDVQPIKMISGWQGVKGLLVAWMALIAGLDMLEIWEGVTERNSNHKDFALDEDPVEPIGMV